MKNALVLFGLILMIGAYTYYDGRNSSLLRSNSQSNTGKPGFSPAPPFFFTDINGKKYSLEQFKGKVILINFWATWCAPCIVEFPQMLELARIKEKETVLLFISIDEDKKDITRFLKKLGEGGLPDNVYVAHDEKRAISTLFQTYKIPETYILDKNLLIHEKIIGADVDWSGPDTVRKIDSLLKN